MANLAIIVPGVNLRASASINAAALRLTSEVTLASVFGVSRAPEADGNLWVEVRTEDGLEAWVRADKVWRVFGDLSLLNAGVYDKPVAGVVAFPPTGANSAQVPVTPLPGGEGLKWSAPLTGYSITDGFHPPTHNGYDLGASEGTLIVARGHGIVFSAEQCPGCPGGDGAKMGTSDPATNYGYGVNVIIRAAYADLPTSAQQALDAAGCTGGYLFTRTAHMQKDLAVKAGDTVSDGQALGRVGTSGNSTGNHTHLETRASLNAHPQNVYAEKLIDPATAYAL